LCHNQINHLKKLIMTRLQAADPAIATGKTKELFNAVEEKLGTVPNMMRTMGNSVAVLNGYLSFSGALNESKIGVRLGEQIALAVAEANQCEYCLSAHTYIGGKLLRLDEATLLSSREAATGDTKTDAALVFAQSLVRKKGLVSDEDVNKVKAAGYGDGEIAEIVAHTALNIFTNYLNNTAKTVVDFPKVELAAVA
jgi:uncharacterized peroxidase-related enzyme